MQILYDGHIYTVQAAGGINRYFSNLITRLPLTYYPALTTCQIQTVNFPTHPNLKIHHYQRFGFRPGRLCYWAEKHFFRIISHWRQFDVVHPTYYNLLTRQEITHYRCPVVLTVWDMIHETFAEQLDPDGRHAWEKGRAILAAQAIICISEHTKKDLLERYSIPEENVFVTHLASEIDSSLSYGPEPTPVQPYFLYVGSRSSYKNFDRLLIAFSQILQVYPDLALCVVGPHFTSEEKKQIAELGLGQHIQHYCYVSDCHLAKLYRCSLAFIYPSLYEGFGIPPLEAMSCGTAVIASNSSSIPEVVGNAGLFFEPESTDELIGSLLDILSSSSKRDRLIKQGFQQAKEFSWDKTVAETIDIYRTVAG